MKFAISASRTTIIFIVLSRHFLRYIIFRLPIAWLSNIIWSRISRFLDFRILLQFSGYWKTLRFWQFVCRRILRYIVYQFPIAWLSSNLVYSLLAIISGVLFCDFQIFEFIAFFWFSKKYLVSGNPYVYAY